MVACDAKCCPTPKGSTPTPSPVDDDAPVDNSIADGPGEAEDDVRLSIPPGPNPFP